MSEPTINDWMTDLGMNLARLEGIVEEVGRHITDGKLDSARRSCSARRSTSSGGSTTRTPGCKRSSAMKARAPSALSP
jgi:hypothetical protein